MGTTTSRVQPLVLQEAAAHPGATLSVIVQMQGSHSTVPAFIAHLGGRVTGDLRIINAIVANVPARAVPALANVPGIRWVSLNDSVVRTSSVATACPSCIDTSNLQNAYDAAIGADRVWNQPPYLQGQGVGVAVVDSGVSQSADLAGRIVATLNFNSESSDSYDVYGHGTFVAGIIAGNGTLSHGAHIGVAPQANIINVKIGNNQGQSTVASVIMGLEWVLFNKDRYNIRVVNLSLNSSVADSYNTDPLDAAVEVLWFSKIVVVVSAGNNGPTGVYAPANDPYVITVGAMDDKGTPSIADDTLAPYSAYGTTPDGISKPDIVAPGSHIVSLLSGPNSVAYEEHEDHRVPGSEGNHYFKMSGTSMAAPMVAGAAALLLQEQPTLTPDQVKYRLMATAVPLGVTGTGAGYLNAYTAVHGTTTQSANAGLIPSALLLGVLSSTASGGVNGSSVNWSSVNWSSVNWSSVNWSSVNWSSVNWSSTYWGN